MILRKLENVWTATFILFFFFALCAFRCIGPSAGRPFRPCSSQPHTVDISGYTKAEAVTVTKAQRSAAETRKETKSWFSKQNCNRTQHKLYINRSIVLKCIILSENLSQVWNKITKIVELSLRAAERARRVRWGRLGQANWYNFSVSAI